MRTRPLALALSLALVGLGTLATGAIVACGGISDPNKVASGEQVQTITGKLTGSAVPASARVALLWKVQGTGRVVVAADVPVVGSTFTMSLANPSAEAFVSAEGSAVGDAPKPGVSIPEPAPADSPGSAGSSGSSGSSSSSSSGGSGAGSPAAMLPSMGLRPMDAVSGTVVTTTLEGAFGGFVIYDDANGNGALDFLPDATLSTTDTILGGNTELVLVVLRGGGQLSYEKLRDKSGILPQPGFNLLWNEQGRWFPLTAIELKLGKGSLALPSPVCASSFSDETAPSTGSSSSGSSGWGGTAPRSDIECAPDGRSYWWKPIPCEPPAPVKPGLCYESYGETDSTCPSVPTSLQTLPEDGSVPEGWPCPIAQDAGAPNLKPPVDAGSP